MCTNRTSLHEPGRKLPRITEENRYINPHHNTPRRVHDYFKARGQTVELLYPGDRFDDLRPYDSEPALQRFDELHAFADRLSYEPPARVEFAQLRENFLTFCARLRERYPSAPLMLLSPVKVNIPDLNKSVSFSIEGSAFPELPGLSVPDLTVSSQALNFCFANPYGFQTLGVSARVRLREDSTNWRMHHLLFVLNNAEISLRPSRLLCAKNLAFLRERSSGGLNLLSYVGSRMRRLSPPESSEVTQREASPISPQSIHISRESPDASIADQLKD